MRINSLSISFISKHLYLFAQIFFLLKSYFLKVYLYDKDNI